MSNSKISEDELIEGEFQKLLSEYLASNHRKRTEIIDDFSKQVFDMSVLDNEGILKFFLLNIFVYFLNSQEFTFII